MKITSINSRVEVIAIDNTSKSKDLSSYLTPHSNVLLKNDSTYPVFVFSGPSGQTAVFPTTGAGQKGQVVLAKTVEPFTWTCDDDTTLYAIQETAGVGNLYICVTNDGGV